MAGAKVSQIESLSEDEQRLILLWRQATPDVRQAVVSTLAESRIETP